MVLTVAAGGAALFQASGALLQAAAARWHLSELSLARIAGGRVGVVGGVTLVFGSTSHAGGVALLRYSAVPIITTVAGRMARHLVVNFWSEALASSFGPVVFSILVTIVVIGTSARLNKQLSSLQQRHGQHL